MSAAAEIYEPETICDGTNRDLWLVERRGGVGSSDAPATLGISPFSNPFELALRKRGLMAENEKQSELLQWGHRVEGPMLDMFLDEVGLEGGLTSTLYRSTEPGHEFMMATPDGWVRDGGEVGGIECKLKMFHAKEWERDGIPNYVITQTQHQMRVMGWAFAFILILLDGYRLRFKRIERNDDVMGEVVIPVEHRWWDDFVADRPFDPTIGNQAATARAIKQLYPEDSGETIRLKGHKYLDHVAKWVEAAEQEKKWKNIKALHQNALKSAIGKATFAALDDGSEISLKTTRVSASTSAGHSYRSLRRIESK